MLINVTKKLTTESRVRLKYWDNDYRMYFHDYESVPEFEQALDEICKLFVRRVSLGSGIGNANSGYMCKPNRLMTISSGFSNAMMASYFHMNGKPINLKAIESIMNKAPQIREIQYLPFGKGVLTYNPHGESFIFYAEPKDFLEVGVPEIEDLYDDGNTKKAQSSVTQNLRKFN